MARQDIFSEIQNWSRSDLQWLRGRIDALLEKRITIHVRPTYKRCGKSGCTCGWGPLDEYGHGPYLIASWREDGQQRQKSLGEHYEPSYFRELKERPAPTRLDTAITPADYAKLPEAKQAGYKQFSMTINEFYRFHGLYPFEDKLGRADRLYYLPESHDQALRSYQAIQDVASSRWAIHGVASPAGIAFLNRMFDRGHTIEFS